MKKQRTGVTGFDDAKFWLALVCYSLSLPLFFEGAVSWQSFQIVMPFLISFIIVATLAWDFRIIGNPNELHCLTLHAAFMISAVFLLNRLMTVEDFIPSLGIMPTLGYAGVDLLAAVPYVSDFLRLVVFSLKWLGYAVILFFVSGAIIFPPRVATALLFLFGLTFVAVSVGQNLNSGLWTLALGLLLQTIAFVLQLEDERRNRFWNRVADALRRGAPIPAADMHIKIDLLRLLHEEKAIGEKQIRGIVASRLGARSDDPAINPVCVRIADQLSSQDRLAESRDGSEGWRFVLSVPAEPTDFFAFAARVVRVGLTLGFCIIYILSPIDLIPDATPVFGVVDDMLLGTVGLLSSLRTIYGTDRQWERTPLRLPFSLRNEK